MVLIYSYDGITWIGNVSNSIIDYWIYSIEYDPIHKLWVSGQVSSKIPGISPALVAQAYSTNGLDWTYTPILGAGTNYIIRYWKAKQMWLMCCFGAGSGNNMLYSYDGKTFKINTSMQLMPNRIYGMGVNDTMAICGSPISTDPNTLAYTYDGINWIGLGRIVINQVYGVEWFGDKWIAYGRAGGSLPNSLAYSYDGINWIGLGNFGNTEIGLNRPYNLSQGVISIKQPIIAGGSASTHTFAISYDGIRWNTVTNNLAFDRVNGIGWNGSQWVAVGNGATTNNTIGYSYDGLSWTGAGNAIFSTGGNGVAWNGFSWIASGEGTNTLAASSNGQTWIPVGASIFSTRANGVAWSGYNWVAVGEGTNTIAYNRTYTGTSGWAGCESTPLTVGKGVGWFGPTQTWVAVGSGPSDSIVYSIDNGVNWTGAGNSVFTYQGNAVASNGSQIVAVGEGTNQIALSTDSINWTVVGTGTFSSLGKGVCWNENRWVAVGEGTNTIAYSEDGYTWYGCRSNVLTTTANTVATNSVYGVTTYTPNAINLYTGNKLQFSGSSYYDQNLNEDISITTKFFSRQRI